MKEVGKIWQSISKEDLKRFEDKASADMKRYEKEH
jgi:hypothetical protein